MRGMDQLYQALVLGTSVLPATQEIWTSFVLCEKGAQVLRATGKSPGFQLRFNSDVSTEVPNKPSSVVS